MSHTTVIAADPATTTSLKHLPPHERRQAIRAKVLENSSRMTIQLARELGVNIKTTSGPVLEKPGDLVGILTNLREQDILFIEPPVAA